MKNFSREGASLIFDGRLAKATPKYVEGHGWDISFEGLDETQRQTVPNLSLETVVDLIAAGRGRNCWQ